MQEKPKEAPINSIRREAWFRDYYNRSSRRVPFNGAVALRAKNNIGRCESWRTLLVGCGPHRQRTGTRQKRSHEFDLISRDSRTLHMFDCGEKSGVES